MLYCRIQSILNILVFKLGPYENGKGPSHPVGTMSQVCPDILLDDFPYNKLVKDQLEACYRHIRDMLES